MRFLNKILLTSIFVSSLISFYYYHTNLQRLIDIQNDRLYIASSGLKYVIPEDYYIRAVQKKIGSDEYTLVNERLNKYAKDLDVEYVYIFAVEKNRFFFLANSTTITDYKINFDNYFYEEYIAQTGDLQKSYESKKILYPEVTDRWGSFYTIVQPYKLSDGNEILLCADIRKEDFDSIRYELIRYTLVIFLFLTILFNSSFKLTKYIIQKKQFPYKNFSKLLHIISIIILILSTSLVGILFNIYNKKIFFSRVDSKVYLTALVMDFILPEDFHNRVENMSKEEHSKYIEPLSKFAIDTSIEYLYTMVEKEGKFYFSISSTNPKDAEKGTITEFMEPWPQIEDAAREAFYTGQIIYRIELGTRWGDFRNIFIPIKKELARPYALGSDFPLNNIKKFLTQNIFISIFLSLFFLFPISSLTYEIVYLFATAHHKIIKRNFLSLKLKITFFISTVTLISIGTVSYFYLLNGKQIIQDKTLEVCKTLASNLSTIAREDLLLDSTYEGTNKALSEIGKNSIDGINSVYLINAFGKVVADLTKTKNGLFATDQEINYIQALNQMELKEEVSVKTKRHFIKITYPIFIEYKGKSLKIGATIFEYDKDKLYKPVYEVQKIIIYIATILLALIIFITYLLSNYVTRPLLYLTESTKIISRGNLNHVISISSNDEVGILSKRFNEMTSHLKHSYEDLEEKVIQRTSELVKSQRTLTSVLENAPLILFATDIEGVVTLSEGKALHLIGIQRGQAVGIPFFDLFEDKPEAIISAKSALGGETVIITETLERFTFEVNYSPLYDINNQIAGMLATYFDITENVKSREIIQAEKEKSDKLLQNILPLKIANELKEKGYVKPTLYKSVTVIFTDFKGFTKIASNMGPEELLDKLDMIFLQFDQICERRKIEKLKTIGDAYMCAGGLPEVNTTHPLDACLAAIEMQNFMNEIKQIMEQISGEEFWDMRLGIHTGEVIAGVIGKTKFAYDVWGDAVNTASRMESNGDIGRINISDTTYSIVQEYFECVHRGKIEAKNKGMIDMYYLLRLKEKYSKDKEGTVPNDLFLQEYSKFINTNHLK